ncbi:nucleoside monophosphate kinase [Candidatus Dojkabacteria bacterium]|nr:nucleoside monophosphate kinase [Candidatus Dojkabacteria bacterium]
MKDLEFPIYKTKSNSNTKYNLNSPKEREQYFKEKAGTEIEDLKRYISDNSFIAYLLGKKQAGKGTYTKLFTEIFGTEACIHLSVGDIVRATDAIKENSKTKKEFIEYLEKNYRGFMPLQDVIDAFLNRSTRTLLPTELILTLVKREIDKADKKNLFIDGFPRNLDQVSYSLYFRELVNYRNDPDLFILFDVDESIIDERIKLRRICPKCNTARNLTTFPTTKIGYDKETKEFYLICDNPECEGARMVCKEDDDKGIENIRDRIEMDDQVIRQAFKLYGIPKILLKNSVPVEMARDLVDDYEITPASYYEWDEKDQKVIMKEKEWVIINDNGVESYSLKAPAVVVSMIKQLHDILIK